jgi:hypothetical protein
MLFSSLVVLGLALVAVFIGYDVALTAAGASLAIVVDFVVVRIVFYAFETEVCTRLLGSRVSSPRSDAGALSHQCLVKAPLHPAPASAPDTKAQAPVSDLELASSAGPDRQLAEGGAPLN